MDFIISVAIVAGVVFLLHYCFGGKKSSPHSRMSPQSVRDNSLLKVFNVKHVNAIVDQFKSLDEVSGAIRKAGLESSNLIFGETPVLVHIICVDFTASNAHQGMRTFGGKSLHHMQPESLNPYQQVIQVMGETLAPFDDDGLIPAFGFGDQSTRDRTVFPFRAEGYCQSFTDVLTAYNQITPGIRLSGPTSFAPIIYQALDIVKQTHQYHILVIVADGQVTSEAPTRRAIVDASSWPLSIILVGVGDGPWDMMQEFDDSLPARKFDNFQFVDYNKVLTYGSNVETTFAVHALMEVPDQYKQIRKLGLLDF